MSILNHFFDYKSEVLALDEKAMEMCQPYFRQMEEIRDFNQLKMLKAFADTQMSSTDMLGTTGYGLWDTGRAKLEQIFAEVMGAEDALVRSQFQSAIQHIPLPLSSDFRRRPTQQTTPDGWYCRLQEYSIDKNADLQRTNIAGCNKMIEFVVNFVTNRYEAAALLVQ